MRIEQKNNIHYKPSFSAKVVHNKALRTTLRDIKSRYGDAYIRKTAEQIKKIGTNNDEIKLVYSTFAYQKGLGMTLQSEGVTFALLNGKNIGHFENRFVSNLLKTLKENIKEQSSIITKISVKKPIQSLEKDKEKKNFSSQRGNIIVKFFKKFFNYYDENKHFFS